MPEALRENGLPEGPGGGLLEAGSGSERLRRFVHRALGTWNVLQLADPRPGDGDRTSRLADAAFRILDCLEDDLSRFRPESDVGALNARGGRGPVPIGRALLEVLEIAREGWTVTGGAFDPTVGSLLDAWGFPRGPARVPPDAEIRNLLERCGLDHLVLDRAARTARFDREGMAVDLGGIGKGYAVDRVADFLRDEGIPSGAVVSGTSSIRVWGPAPEGGAWRIEVAHPEEPDASIRTLEFATGSISTSAAYEERFVLDGVEYGHILDPRTGRPVRNAVRSVTVWTPEAVQGDLLSTALFVLGPEGGKALFARLGSAGILASALLVLQDPGVWGGLSLQELHSGPPGFREAPDGA